MKLNKHDLELARSGFERWLSAAIGAYKNDPEFRQLMDEMLDNIEKESQEEADYQERIKEERDDWYLNRECHA